MTKNSNFKPHFLENGFSYCRKILHDSFQAQWHISKLCSFLYHFKCLNMVTRVKSKTFQKLVIFCPEVKIWLKYQLVKKHPCKLGNSSNNKICYPSIAAWIVFPANCPMLLPHSLCNKRFLQVFDVFFFFNSLHVEFVVEFLHHGVWISSFYCQNWDTRFITSKLVFTFIFTSPWL